MFKSTGYDYQFQISQALQYGISTEVLPEIERPAKWKLSYGNDPAPTCPRCASSNTKFCYYNNYSFSQPRYFCKGCRRYWTKGGTLRNVPIGGGCRKSRRRANNNNRRFGRVNNLRNRRDDQNPDEEFRAGSGSDGSEIDLAVVFAKFLSGQSPTGTTSSSGATTNFDQESPNDESNGAAAATADVSDCFDWNVGNENDMILGFYQDSFRTQKPGLPQEEFNPGVLPLQDFLNDEEIQDVLWSDNWHPLGLQGP